MQNTPNQNILYGIIGLLLGIVLTVIVVNGQMYGMMRMMGLGKTANNMMAMQDSSSMSMANMMKELSGKTGDDFDKAFISSMIAHHQGAIDMATEAKKSAKHDEIKAMADAIIAAQTKEINDMKGWYKAWYGTDVPTSSTMMSH